MTLIPLPEGEGKGEEEEGDPRGEEHRGEGEAVTRSSAMVWMEPSIHPVAAWIASSGIPSAMNWGEKAVSPPAIFPRISSFVARFSCIAWMVMRIPAARRRRRVRVITMAESQPGIRRDSRFWRGATTTATANPKGIISSHCQKARKMAPPARRTIARDIFLQRGCFIDPY